VGRGADGFAYSDLATPLHDVVGREEIRRAPRKSPTVRQEIRLWTAAVLRQRPRSRCNRSPWAGVRRERRRRSTGAPHGRLSRRAEPTAIPVGLYTSGASRRRCTWTPIFLLGPEAAHLNIAGVSGSPPRRARWFLLGSIFQHFPPHRADRRGVLQREGSTASSTSRARSRTKTRRYERLAVGRSRSRRALLPSFKADGVN